MKNKHNNHIYEKKRRTLMRLALPTVRRSFHRHNLHISNLIRSNQLAEARHYFDSLLPHSRNVVTWNSILTGYVKERQLVEARKLFERMPQKDVTSWNVILSGYVGSVHELEFEEGRKLFDEMPKRDAVSWSTMISGYVRNRRMNDALKLFDRMDVRNVVSWNALITGYLSVGEVQKALKMFDEMPVRDGASLTALVSGLLNNGRLREAEELLRNKELKKIERAVDAYNALIAYYGQNGMVGKARRLFNSIPRNKKWKCEEQKGSYKFERNLVSWNSMIMSYAKAGDFNSARKLFDIMPDRDLFSWNTIISCYTQALEMEKAELLFNKMPYKDFVSYNLIIFGFSQKGDMERALCMFNQMTHKNTVIWNTMISGYVQNREYEKAIEFFSKMQMENKNPDKYTLSSVLGICSNIPMLSLGTQIHQLILKNFIPDTSINNGLITMYSKCGILKDARKVFDEMKFERDVITYNAMLAGFAYHGLAREALKVFNEMKGMKIKPTYITFISLIHACGHKGLINEGKEVFHSMIHEYGIEPRVEHHASLVDLIGRHGSLHDALMLIYSMKILPNQAVWGAFLGACRLHRNAKLAQVAYRALKQIEPDSSVPYVLLHNLHVDEGRLECAKKIRQKMDRLGVVKQTGFSQIEVHHNVHVFVSGDTSHLFSHEIYSLLESYNRIVKDLNPYNMI